MKAILIGAVLLVGLAFGAAKFYLYYKVSEGMDSAVLAISPYAQIEYGGISSTITGELTVDDVKVVIKGYSDGFTIGRLGIDTPSFLSLLSLSDFAAGTPSASNETPEYFGFIAEDMRIRTKTDYYKDYYQAIIKQLAPADIRQRGVQCVGKYGFSPKVLQALGYDEIIASMTIGLSQTENSFITQMNVDAVDMLNLEMNLQIAGNLMAGVASGPYYRPKMSDLTLKITDQSLNARVEKLCTKLGLTPAQILAARLNALQYRGKSNGIEFDEYVIDPYKEYLAGKSTLIITARPREPLDLARIEKYKPSDVPALLNLEAVAQ